MVLAGLQLVSMGVACYKKSSPGPESLLFPRPACALFLLRSHYVAICHVVMWPEGPLQSPADAGTMLLIFRTVSQVKLYTLKMTQPQVLWYSNRKWINTEILKVLLKSLSNNSIKISIEYQHRMLLDKDFGCTF